MREFARVATLFRIIQARATIWCSARAARPGGPTSRNGRGAAACSPSKMGNPRIHTPFTPHFGRLPRQRGATPGLAASSCKPSAPLEHKAGRPRQRPLPKRAGSVLSNASTAPPSRYGGALENVSGAERGTVRCTPTPPFKCAATCVAGSLLQRRRRRRILSL